MTSSKIIISDYKELFEGVGKLRSYQVKLHVNPELELHPDSRSITTFTTHCGIQQYKRLKFTIRSAPEVYQHVIQQSLQGCEGVSQHLR